MLSSPPVCVHFLQANDQTEGGGWYNPAASAVSSRPVGPVPCQPLPGACDRAVEFPAKGIEVRNPDPIYFLF